MSEYRIKSSFLKLSLFFALGLNSFAGWAFNSMCHSPVQLAALMSPNKPKLSKGEQLKKRIKALEKKIEDYENKMDDVEGELGDSLSETKLKEDPYSVAGSIRSYIENSQNGWPCAGGQKASLRESLFHFPAEYFTQNSFLKRSFLDLILPSAHGQTVTQKTIIKVEGGNTSGGNTSGGKKTESGDNSPAPDFNFLDENACPAGQEPVGDTCKPECPTGQIRDEGECTDTPKTECEKRRGAWEYKTLKGGSSQCKCPEPNVTVREGNELVCRKYTDQERCNQDTTKAWTSEGCVCKSGFGLEKGQCVKCSEKEDGGQWKFQDINSPCQCDTTNNKDIKRDGDRCRSKTNKEKCTELGKNWTGDNDNDPMSKCKTQDEIDEGECNGQQGKEWVGGDCVCKRGFGLEKGQCVECSKKAGEQWKFQGIKLPCKCDTTNNKEDGNECRLKTQAEKCQEKGPNWVAKGSGCDCPAPFVEDPKDGKCRKQTDEERCKERGGIYSENETPPCVCPPGHKVEKQRCVKKNPQDKCEEQEGMSWIGGECVSCPDWKKHGGFRRNGKVDSSFCDAYAQDKRACKNALGKLGRMADRLEKYQDSIEKLEEELMGLDDSENTKTEAGGLCFDCLKRELKANRPTAGQTFGNIASMLAGVGISMAGYNTGQIAQSDANMLRIQQGYPVSNDYYALQGATAGFPFIANGLYGMTRVNTPVGGWSCTPSMSPYGHAYGGYGYGYGYQMPYY